MDDGIWNLGTNHRDDLYIWQTAQYVRDLGYHQHFAGRKALNKYMLHMFNSSI